MKSSFCLTQFFFLERFASFVFFHLNRFNHFIIPLTNCVIICILTRLWRKEPIHRIDSYGIISCRCAEQKNESVQTQDIQRSLNDLWVIREEEIEIKLSWWLSIWHLRYDLLCAMQQKWTNYWRKWYNNGCVFFFWLCFFSAFAFNFQIDINIWQRWWGRKKKLTQLNSLNRLKSRWSGLVAINSHIIISRRKIKLHRFKWILSNLHFCATSDSNFVDSNMKRKFSKQIHPSYVSYTQCKTSTSTSCIYFCTWAPVFFLLIVVDVSV